MNLNDYCEESWDVAYSKGWHAVYRSFGDLIALIHSEVSEALEAFRESGQVRLVSFVDGKPEGVPIELADVLIRIFDLCEDYEIDLETAYRIKTEYNKSRDYRHGGKRL